ncbi:MAG: NosD domain-containing protein [Candidatus Helarchaeota archaeon]
MCDNFASNNTNYGIRLYYANENMLSANYLNDSATGIYLDNTNQVKENAS